MSSWSTYFFGEYRQKKEDHSDVVDLLESVRQRDWSNGEKDKEEVDAIVKRLRYRHPRTPPRQTRLSRRDVGQDDDGLQLNVLDSMNNMLPRTNSNNIKIDSSSMPQGGLLRDFGGSTASKSGSSDGRSQGTNESADDSIGATSAFTDGRNL